MVNILMIIINCLILTVYISYFILIFIGRKSIISKSTSFDVCKDLISEYNSINIVESKKYFSFYNIKRNVIKLSSGCYYGKDLSSISIGLIEAGNSILKNKNNKFINIIGKLVSNLKLLYLLPIILLVINNSFYSVIDSGIGIFVVVLFILVSYNFIDIKTNIYNWLCDDLVKIKDINKDNRNKIMSFINIVLFLDKIIFVSETLVIIKFVMILLGLS